MLVEFIITADITNNVCMYARCGVCVCGVLCVVCVCMCGCMGVCGVCMCMCVCVGWCVCEFTKFLRVLVFGLFPFPL